MSEMPSFESRLGKDLKEGETSKALLVGAYSGRIGKITCLEHLEELDALADTFGVDTYIKMPCNVRKIDPSTYLHQGKLEEIAQEIALNHINLVIFDEEITPAQQRNLEKLLKIAVMDRTELILEIFAQRAHTKEAQIQIELARTKYEFPRLKRLWSHFSKQKAKGGHLKGEGEKQLEIDKRLLQHKLKKLTQDLNQVKKYRLTQSAARRRSNIPTLALIGYTNAGKSTLINALTDANVFVEDKLFATLDPTTRKFTLPNNQEILITDTVGFVRKLPHSLVAAFRSTLEAALHDDILLHIIDVSHPQAEEQAETTFKLLKELDVKVENVLTLFNKIDACEDQQIVNRLRVKYTKNVTISALNREGFDDLSSLIMQELKQLRQIIKLKIPQSEYALVTTLRREGNILYEEYEDNDVIIRAEIPLSLIYQFEPYLYESDS